MILSSSFQVSDLCSKQFLKSYKKFATLIYQNYNREWTYKGDKFFGCTERANLTKESFMENEELCKKFDKKYPKFFSDNSDIDSIHLFTAVKMKYLTTCYNPRSPIPGSGESGLRFTSLKDHSNNTWYSRGIDTVSHRLCLHFKILFIVLLEVL